MNEKLRQNYFEAIEIFLKHSEFAHDNQRELAKLFLYISSSGLWAYEVAMPFSVNAAVGYLELGWGPKVNPADVIEWARWLESVRCRDALSEINLFKSSAIDRDSSTIYYLPNPQIIRAIIAHVNEGLYSEGYHLAPPL